METVKEVESKDDIYNYCGLKEFGFKVEDIIIKKLRFDSRINWNTFIVICEGLGVLGFTNGDIIK